MTRQFLFTNLFALLIASTGCQMIADFKAEGTDAGGAEAGGRSNKGGGANQGGAPNVGGVGGAITSGGKSNANAGSGTSSGGVASTSGGATTSDGGSAGASVGGVGTGGVVLGGSGGIVTSANGGDSGNGGVTPTSGGTAGSSNVTTTGAATGGVATAGGKTNVGGASAGGVTTSTGGLSAGGVATGGVATGGAAPSTGGTSSTGGTTSTTPYVSSLSLGQAHACAVKSNGAVWCWGHAELGELGTAASNSTATSVRILGLPGSIGAVSSALNHNCALDATRSVYCWGNNEYGQISGAVTSTPITTPIAIAGLSNIAAVDVGGTFACALSTSGTVSCWGANGAGQLGNASAPNPSTAVSVTAIAGATAISSGAGHSCVLTSGKIHCWGYNSTGQLGNSAMTSNMSATPVQVDGITTATAVSAGSTHTCAILADKTVRCWGYGSSGELGNNVAAVGGPTAVQAQGIATATAISCGYWSSCALLENGTVSCWGYNNSGQVGNGDTANAKVLVPSTVLSPQGDGQLSSVIAIEAGEEFACALTAVHDVYCWGVGANFRNGDPNQSVHYFPVKVAGI